MNGTAGHDGGLQPLKADTLLVPGIQHGFFTRQGGVSSGIYASLNCGRGSKDDGSHVAENRARVAHSLGVEASRMIGPRQAHTKRIAVADTPWLPDEAPEADGVVTTARGLAIGVLSADCGPVLLADPDAGVIAAVHAGWKGAKAGILGEAIAVMEQHGARRDAIRAALGPTISVEAYEVGPEFRDAFLADDGRNAGYFIQSARQSRPHFDLPRFIMDSLAREGIRHCKNLARCTYSEADLFFSHRRAVHRGEADYGRQISAIVLT
jgi:YfiH family protein